MQELREALDNYMRNWPKRPSATPTADVADMQGMEMTGDQLQQMLDELQR
jgi:hypothetical protein